MSLFQAAANGGDLHAPFPHLDDLVAVYRHGRGLLWWKDRGQSRGDQLLESPGVWCCSGE